MCTFTTAVQCCQIHLHQTGFPGRVVAVVTWVKWVVCLASVATIENKIIISNFKFESTKH